MNWSDLRWGTLGEWAAALAAAALIATTLGVWRRDRRSGDRQRELEDASKINVWFQGNAAANSAGRIVDWKMVVQNAGATTIYEWEAAVWWAQLFPPGTGYQKYSHHMSGHRNGPLYPGAEFAEWITFDGPVNERPQTRDLRAAMFWRTPRGDKWWLRMGGELYDHRLKWPQPWAIAFPTQGPPDLDALAAKVLPKKL